MKDIYKLSSVIIYPCYYGGAVMLHNSPYSFVASHPTFLDISSLEVEKLKWYWVCKSVYPLPCYSAVQLGKSPLPPLLYQQVEA